MAAALTSNNLSLQGGDSLNSCPSTARSEVPSPISKLVAATFLDIRNKLDKSLLITRSLKVKKKKDPSQIMRLVSGLQSANVKKSVENSVLRQIVKKKDSKIEAMEKELMYLRKLVESKQEFNRGPEKKIISVSPNTRTPITITINGEEYALHAGSKEGAVLVIRQFSSEENSMTLT